MAEMMRLLMMKGGPPVYRDPSEKQSESDDDCKEDEKKDENPEERLPRLILNLYDARKLTVTGEWNHAGDFLVLPHSGTTCRKINLIMAFLHGGLPAPLGTHVAQKDPEKRRAVCGPDGRFSKKCPYCDEIFHGPSEWLVEQNTRMHVITVCVENPDQGQDYIPVEIVKMLVAYVQGKDLGPYLELMTYWIDTVFKVKLFFEKEIEAAGNSMPEKWYFSTAIRDALKPKGQQYVTLVNHMPTVWGNVSEDRKSVLRECLKGHVVFLDAPVRGGKGGKGGKGNQDANDAPADGKGGRGGRGGRGKGGRGGRGGKGADHNEGNQEVSGAPVDGQGGKGGRGGRKGGRGRGGKGADHNEGNQEVSGAPVGGQGGKGGRGRGRGRGKGGKGGKGD